MPRAARARASSGGPVRGLAVLGEGRVRLAPLQVEVRDPLADHPVAGPEALRLAELRLRGPALALLHQDGPEVDAEVGVLRPEPHPLAERDGGGVEAARVAERPAEVVEGEVAPGAEGHRDRGEADRLVGPAQVPEGLGEVMVDPEIVGMGPLREAE